MGRSGQTKATRPAPVTRTPRTAPVLEPFRRYTFEQFAAETLRIERVESAAELRAMITEIKRLEPRTLAFDCEVAGMEEVPFEKEIRRNGKTETISGVDLVGGFPRMFQLGVHDPYRGISPRQWLVDLGPDPQAPTLDARPVHELLGNPELEKQIHFGDFEQEQWLRYAHEPIKNIVDSCRSWMSIQKALEQMSEEKRCELGFAGWEKQSNGLASICRYVLGFELPKDERVSDWGAETLSEEQLRYAALDVAVLPPLVSRTKLVVRTLKLERKVRNHHFMANREVLDRVLPEIRAAVAA